MRFTTIRVPLSVKKQIEELRTILQNKKEYKWAGKLSIGDVVSYALTKMEKIITMGSKR